MIARRAAREVAACDLEPAQLPPSAILIVRRMPDPAPRKLLTDRPHWERKARAKLEEAAAQAVRAAHGETPESAIAVWFEDTAEMTACLVADIAAGRAQRRWWWRIPLREVRSVTREVPAVATVLLRAPHTIPEVLHLLERQGALEAVLRSLSESEVERILRALEHVFAVPAPAVDAQPRQQLDPRVPGRSPDPPSGDSIIWQDAVRSAAGQASADVRSVERLLLLVRALRCAVGSSSRAELLTLYRGIESTRETRNEETISPRAAAVSGAHADRCEEQARPIADQATRTLTVETEWGGVLYLINVMKALGLPASVHDGIGGWAMLELMGRCLSGPEANDDALWRAVAIVDGREPGEPAGASVRDPAAYCLPARWACPAMDSVYARARGRRLLLWHPSGFALYDGPFTDADRPVEHSRRRCRARVPRQSTPALHRLASFVVPYVAWWLREARGIHVDLRHVLRIPGTVRISPTHVDVVFGMDSVSLPVRMAGLDANPGWMPALGRAITYHFQ